MVEFAPALYAAGFPLKVLDVPLISVDVTISMISPCSPVTRPAHFLPHKKVRDNRDAPDAILCVAAETVGKGDMPRAALTNARNVSSSLLIASASSLARRALAPPPPLEAAAPVCESGAVRCGESSE